MSSVTLLAPPIRMMVFAAWDVDHEYGDIDNSDHPVLAIRSVVGPDGKCEDDLLILPTLGEGGKLVTVREAFPASKYTTSIHYCNWTPDEEAEKLRIIRWHVVSEHQQRRVNAAEDVGMEGSFEELALRPLDGRPDE